MRRALALLALFSGACAAGGGRTRELPAALREDPAVRAATAEAEAADAARGEGEVLREAELRARAPLTAPLGSGIPDDDGRRMLELAARLSFDSPFAVAAGRRAAEAEAEAAWARLGRVASDRRGQLCSEGVAAGRAGEQRRLAEETLARLAPLEAALVADPAQYEAHAQLLRFRLRVRPRPVVGELLLPLPPLPEALPPLDRSPETILARVRSAPGADEGLHLARAEEARADEALHEALPRLGYVEAGLEPGALDVLAGTVARVGVEIPLQGLSGEARATHLAAAARATAEASERTRLQLAATALATLARYEESGPDLRALEAAATLFERLAVEGLGNGALSAADGLSRLTSAFAARETLLDARAEAGEARCALEAATGVQPAAWPRRP